MAKEKVVTYNLAPDSPLVIELNLNSTEARHIQSLISALADGLARVGGSSARIGLHVAPVKPERAPRKAKKAKR